MKLPTSAFPETLLHVEGVTVTFGDFTALDDLTFSMRRGELRVVIGPNGAGKSTLLDVITGKVRPRSGRVLFRDRDVTGAAVDRLAARGIGRKFQTPNVFKNLTILENLSLALKAPRGVMATLAGMFGKRRLERVYSILETIGLAHKPHTRAGVLAHGEKQWLELGMVMAQDPELLLIDEPVAGMTPRESERTGELLLATSRNHTLLVIEHDMTFVRQIASRVTVLDEGRVICDGTVEEVQRDQRVIEVYLGQDREADVEHPSDLCLVR